MQILFNYIIPGLLIGLGALYWRTYRIAARQAETEIARLKELAQTTEANLKEMERRAQASAQAMEDLRKARNVAWPKPEGRMSEAEVLEEFNVDVDEPWFAAVMQEIDDALADILNEVTLPPSGQLTAETRTHTAGGGESIRLLLKRLLDLRERAAGADDDADGDTKDEQPEGDA